MDEAINDETLSFSSKTHALAQTSASDRVSIDSNKLNTAQPNNILRKI